MSKYLQTRRFKWLNPVKFNLDKYDNDSLRGYILKVDLEYTNELHELHSDYPLSPDK